MRNDVLFLIVTIFILTLAFSGSASAATDQNITANQENASLNDSSNQSTNTVITQTQYEGSPDSLDIRGYWINNGPSALNNMNITALKKAGITDLFVVTSRQNPEGTLTPFIDAFSGSDIRIHAWITCFKDQNGNWIDPGDPAQMDQLINDITSLATNYNVDGIHLDYARYPGTAYLHPNATQNVTSFVQTVYNSILNINSQQIAGKHQILLSAALMPERGVNGYYYGQDYGQLAPYLDFLVPMIYKGNYLQDTAWVGATTQYIVQHACGKPVVAGLQTYRSDAYPIPIPACELNSDINAAQVNGSAGYVLFRYGLVDSSMSGIAYKTVTLAQIISATVVVKDYIEKYYELPSNATVGTVQVNMATFLYLLSNGLMNINHGSTSPVELKDFREPLSPSESVKSGNMLKNEYLNMALSIQNFMEVNGKAPNYTNSSLGGIRYESLIYAYSRILNYYGLNKVLPNYVSVTPWSVPRVISTNPASNATEVSLTSPITITFSENIAAGTNYSGIYLKNTASGATVTITKAISGNTLTIQQTISRKNNTLYQVYIPAGAVKNTAGNSLTAAYTYNFTTIPADTTPPTITSTNPTSNAPGVSLTSAVIITFSENIAAGANYSGIYLKNKASGALVNMTKSISGNTLTIQQTTTRKNNTLYQVYIPAGAVKDTAGNSLTAAYTYNFTTIPGTTDTTPPTIRSTNPTSNATGVSLTSPITITFSENITAGTNYAGIYIKNLTSGKTVSIASKTISGNTLTIKMISSRLSKNTYQVYLPAGTVKDVAGNSLNSSYTCQFKTI